jgi:alpha-D-ribose 1-methylphosphonate 5-triphosphate synthase subunit PhnH
MPLSFGAGDPLAPGFAEPVLDSQRTFRAVLEAMARPGTVCRLDRIPAAPEPLAPAAAAICLALVDLDTPLWLDAAAAPAAAYLRFHCGCPIPEEPESAVFALLADAGHLPSLERFAAGDADYPDRSATLILQVAGLTAGEGRRLSGPGIDGAARLAIAGLDDAFWPAWTANRARFPLGFDVVLAAGERLAALPRTTLVED